MSDFVLWGYHPHRRNHDGAVAPIQLTSGNLRHVKSERKRREAQGGWTLAIHPAHTEPVALRLQCAQDHPKVEAPHE